MPYLEALNYLGDAHGMGNPALHVHPELQVKIEFRMVSLLSLSLYPSPSPSSCYFLSFSLHILTLSHSH
jgi:hypothetical protein